MDRHRKTWWLKGVWWLAAVWLLLGCGLLDTAVTGTPPPDTGDPSQSGTADSTGSDGSTPEPGLGGVLGTVLWNGTAAAGVEVTLCREYRVLLGCTVQEFTTTTTGDGAYRFTDVPSGAYNIAVRVFDTDEWLTIEGDLFRPTDFVVKANETLIVEPFNLYKQDLRPIYPQEQDKVRTGELTLSWEVYPGAAYYQIYLSADKGEAIFVNEQVEFTEITTMLRPINCDYFWQLKAFNGDGVKIAETPTFTRFRASGGKVSCTLQINSPLDGDEISGSGIVLDWEPNGMAVSYKILMWNDSDPEKPKVLDFVPVNETRFALNGELAPARYVWVVYAYGEQGEEIAESEIFDFTVAAFGR
ncbi:MAG: hypothetical protein ACE5E7_13650 [Anaerolineae bacterium]